MSIVTMATAMMAVIRTIVRDHHDGTPYDMPRIRINIHHARFMDDDRRVRPTNFTATIRWAGVVDDSANHCTGGRSNNRTLSPAIVVMPADDCSRHCP
jgi:hypothetical protein